MHDKYFLLTNLRSLKCLCTIQERVLYTPAGQYTTCLNMLHQRLFKPLIIVAIDASLTPCNGKPTLRTHRCLLLIGIILLAAVACGMYMCLQTQKEETKVRQWETQLNIVENITISVSTTVDHSWRHFPLCNCYLWGHGNTIFILQFL